MHPCIHVSTDRYADTRHVFLPPPPWALILVISASSSLILRWSRRTSAALLPASALLLLELFAARMLLKAADAGTAAGVLEAGWVDAEGALEEGAPGTT